MINNLTIKDCFAGLVGWRESAKAPDCYDPLDDELLESSSGVYFNDIPGLSLEIINDIKGKDYADVNTYLTDSYDAAVQNLMNQFVIKQKKEVYTKSLLKNQDIGIYAENIRKAGLKNNRFVGFEIVPHESNSIRAEILQFGGMFTKEQKTFPIYFYCSTQLEPIGIYYADYNNPNSLEWFQLIDEDDNEVLSFICDFINNTYGHGMRYFIGYYESDLDANNFAIITRTPCYDCNHSDRFDFNKYVSIRPCEVEAGHTYESRELFDIDAVGYSDNTYGLFLKANATCDVSQVICENKGLFAIPLQKAMAIKLFWDAYNAPASAFNANTSTKKSDFKMMAEKLELELNGGVIGERYQKGELETLTIDFSNIDQTCLGMRKKSFGVLQL